MMNIQSLKLVSFSPTGTTRAVLQGVARGINADSVEFIDITHPDTRKQPLTLSENDLLVMGVPVYMGRVPALLSDWLGALDARQTPAAGIVVYGNRAYENALLELMDVLQERGCVPIAGAAFIGEHSFSSPDIPTAHGRPDASDLRQAEQFGRGIAGTLGDVTSPDRVAGIQFPGSRPYDGVAKLWDVDFIAIGDECSQCGLCAEVCPMGAIDPENSTMIDIEKCITCCACIKNCPQNARGIKPGPVQDAQHRLSNMFHERKEPECSI